MDSPGTTTSDHTPGSLTRTGRVVVVCFLAALLTGGIVLLTADLLPIASAPAAGAVRSGAVTAVAPPALAEDPASMERVATKLSTVRQDLHKVALSADDLIRLLEVLELSPTDPKKTATQDE